MPLVFKTAFKDSTFSLLVSAIAATLLRKVSKDLRSTTVPSGSSCGCHLDLKDTHMNSFWHDCAFYSSIYEWCPSTKEHGPSHQATSESHCRQTSLLKHLPQTTQSLFRKKESPTDTWFWLDTWYVNEHIVHQCDKWKDTLNLQRWWCVSQQIVFTSDMSNINILCAA